MRSFYTTTPESELYYASSSRDHKMRPTASMMSDTIDTDDESEHHSEVISGVKPAIRVVEAEEKGEGAEIVRQSTDIIDEMGISGLALMAHNNKDIMMLLCISAQAFTMQYVLLWNLWLATPKQEEEAESDVPYLLMCISIYLHFLNCITDIPFGFAVLGALPHILGQSEEDKWISFLHIVINFPCFIIDALCTPFFTLVIGSFFLCSSESVPDVLLNSCAVAFIKEIDNWILQLNAKMKYLAGVDDNREVDLPYYPKTATGVEWVVIILPLVPMAYTLIITHIGTEVLHIR